MEKIVSDIFAELDGNKWTKCTDRTPRSTSCVECLRLQYFDDNDVSYDCVEKRKLYVIRFLPIHAAENRAGLRRVAGNVMDNILRYAPIRILSLGGGPGSDIHATLEFLKQEIEDVSLHRIFITRMDIEPLWDDVARDVIQSVAGDLLFRLDTMHADVMEGLDTLRDDDEEFDIALCSYLISELDEADLKGLGKKLRGVMWNGGIIVINDRAEIDVERKIRIVFEAADVDCSEAGNREWAGFRYEDEIFQKVRPKVYMNSTVFWGVKRDN
ncbi:hypothetical protein [Pseudomonas fluorescens]|nr:hypothetical protein [Pseudomonas fluorescens]